jgi:hypothetical protein
MMTQLCREAIWDAAALASAILSALAVTGLLLIVN